MSPNEHAQLFAQALPAIQHYQNKTIVIKYGGNAMTDAKLKQSFASNLVLLNLLGIKTIVVHGGGPQIDSALQQLGKTGAFIQGMRVTDEETMNVVKWVLCGEVQQEIVARINQLGGRAVGLSGQDGGLMRARKLMVTGQAGEKLDIGYVGEVEAINPQLINTLLQDGFIPVVSPIACDHQGHTYNINADLVAGKLAQMFQAEKLIMMTNISGVLDKAGNLLTRLSTQEIDKLFADGTLSGGMLPKISAALNAAKEGVRSVQILDGRVEHALLLDLLLNQTSGTLIYP